MAAYGRLQQWPRHALRGGVLREGACASCMCNNRTDPSHFPKQHFGRSKLPQGQCTSRRSLRVLLALKSNNAGEKNQPSPSTNSTLAALDLLLGVVQQQQQQQQPSTQEAEAASTQHPATCLDDTVSLQQTDVGASTTLSPEAIWSEAWGCVEACQPSVPTLHHVTPQTLPKESRFQRFSPFSSKQHKDHHMLSGKQQRRQGIQQNQSRQSGVSKSPVKQVQLHLQGLETKARLQLLALSLAALERQIAAFSSAHIRLSLREWQEVAPSVLAACSCQAATAWLGRCPEELQLQALQVVCRLQRGLTSEASLGVQQVVQMLLRHLQLGSGDAQDSSAPSTEAVNPANLQEATEEAETVAASSAAASSKGPWQSAAENNPVHAVVLQHMCQLHPTPSTLMTSAAACDPPQTSRQPLHSASEVTLHEGSGQQRPQARAHIPAASKPEVNSTQLRRSPAVTSIHAEATSTSSSPNANTSSPPSDAHRSATPTVMSSATQPHPSSSFPEPAVPDDVALQTSVTSSSPQGASGVRQAAHKRLANPNRQKLRQAASRQHEATAFRAVLQAAPAVLQDMAVNIAEAASACYLAEARSGLQGNAYTNEGWWPLHLHARLRSTRSLERFRNQIALAQLIHQNTQSIVAMYEDRHNLVTLGPGVQLLQQPVSVRRIKELEALKGWKFFLSFMLEAGDVLLPVARSCMARVSAAVSWLLVKLIGRALGLIYRGVKQSLTQQPKPKQSTQNSGSEDSAVQDQRAWFPGFT